MYRQSKNDNWVCPLFFYLPLPEARAFIMFSITWALFCIFALWPIVHIATLFITFRHFSQLTFCGGRAIVHNSAQEFQGAP
jgi:hypothetical protein